MTNERFQQILKAWHYENYTEYTAEEIRQLRAFDPFWTVASLEKDLNESFWISMSSVSPGKAAINAAVMTNQNQLKGTSKY